MAAKKQSFEEAMKRLEEIVSLLERGDKSLEESLGLFEEGTKLMQDCTALLAKAEQKVLLLTQDAEGGVKLSTFTEAEGE